MYLRLMRNRTLVLNLPNRNANLRRRHQWRQSHRTKPLIRIREVQEPSPRELVQLFLAEAWPPAGPRLEEHYRFRAGFVGWSDEVLLAVLGKRGLALEHFVIVLLRDVRVVPLADRCVEWWEARIRVCGREPL